MERPYIALADDSGGIAAYEGQSPAVPIAKRILTSCGLGMGHAGETTGLHSACGVEQLLGDTG